MKKSVIIFFCFLVLLSCGKKKKDFGVPSELIPRDTMVRVLADIHLSEAKIMTANYGMADSIKNASYYKFVFQKHKLDVKQFQKSFDFYSKNAELMKSVYDDVLNELSRRQAEELK